MTSTARKVKVQTPISNIIVVVVTSANFVDITYIRFSWCVSPSEVTASPPQLQLLYEIRNLNKIKTET